MAEVEKTSRKPRGRSPFGRWLSPKEAAKALVEPAPTQPLPVPDGPVGRPGRGELPEVVEVNTRQVMGARTELPSEPRMVKWAGEHLFVVMVAYGVDPLQLAQALGKPSLTAADALDVSPPQCYWCDQVWTLRTGRSRCRGERQI